MALSFQRGLQRPESALNRTSDLDLELIRVASLLENDPATAARQAAQILRSHPGHPPALLLLGSAHRREGDPEAAVADFAALAAAQPGSAVINLELGRALHAAGRDVEALVALQEAVRLAPDLAEAWRELSRMHAARGDPAACDAAYRRFEQLMPEEERLAEPIAALANERFDAAQALLQQVLERSPADVAALRLRARVAVAREDYAQAERLLGECLQVAPGYSRARLDLVDVLHQQQLGEPMLPLLERLLTAEPGDRRYLSLLASAHTLVGHTEQAIRILEELLSALPVDEVAWLNYGHSLRAAGRYREAIDAYRRCIELQPGCGGAWLALADLKTYRFSGGDVEAMQIQLAREEMRHEERSRLEFALGKALEDAGDFAGAFRCYAQGNALRRAVIRYDSANTTRFRALTQALCTPEFLAERAGWGCPSAEPIFIIGMPRAGSTLVEQILASHSQVEGTRELSLVIRFAMDLGDREQRGSPATYPQSLARLTHVQFCALGERYLAQSRAHRLQARPRFIDKMGANFQHVPLIHLMLPNARIIDARRSALGCCFANFKQHFHAGAWFSYSLEDLGHYYRDYVSLMAHFDRVLPGRIHRVCYEELVRDLEREVRRLLDYCGLPFEAQCLRFHETRRIAQTVSSEQVRQPLYTEGVEQWRNFEPWLGPLKEALAEQAVR
jgi:tetratricopeptide (TPR) repeat protein